MRRNFLNSRGFTLVEVLASVVLLAVVLSISLSIFPSMFKTNNVNEESLDAVAVAKDTLIKAKNGAIKSKTFIPVSTSQETLDLFPSDEQPDDSHFTYNEITPLGDYKVYYIIDPTNVDSLGLYEVSIYVVERDTIRATNYGYIETNNMPPGIVGGP